MVQPYNNWKYNLKSALKILVPNAFVERKFFITFQELLG